MDDYELMKNYSLSAKGLKNVFDKLLQAGTIDQDDLDNRMLVTSSSWETCSVT